MLRMMIELQQQLDASDERIRYLEAEQRKEENAQNDDVEFLHCIAPRSEKRETTKKKVIKSAAKVVVNETEKDRQAREKRVKKEREQYLRHACFNGPIHEVRKLLDRGVDINAKNNYGTPLMFACSNGDLEIATLLLDRDALIDEKTSYDNTALHITAEFDYMDVCELLISRGADPMAVNRLKQPPLDVIGMERDGNDPDDPDENELPPLTAAEKKEREDRLLEVFGEYLE